MMTATYSPEDNKLRLYSPSRLDAELYARVKTAGFSYAPKQQLFVAPMWTPQREDLLLELCGEIEDEDKSLVERAEERSERFADYSESRARRDAQQTTDGTRHAGKMWDTAKYWTDRADAALRHAKYKERPDVRARRIKGLEAHKRKQERYLQEADMWLKLWTECANEQDKGLQAGVALRLAGMCRFHLPPKEGDREDFTQTPSAYDALNGSFPHLYAPRTLEEVVTVALDTYPRSLAHHGRWLTHYENRIAYEKAMLAESGGTVADRNKPERGGACRSWVRGGRWTEILKVNKVSVTVADNWGNGGPDFTRTIPFHELKGVITKAEFAAMKAAEASPVAPSSGDAS